MGRRGPAPKPTALRVLHGDDACRINHNEPQPLDTPVRKPDWLTPMAAEEWDHIAPHLVAMGTVKDTDIAALAAYCECYARWRRLVHLVNNSQPLLNHGTPENPHMVKNPAWSQVRDAEAALRVMAREFGLTPSARAGLRVDVTVHNPVDRFMTGS